MDENKKTFAEEIIRKIKEIEQDKGEDIYSMENDIKNGFVVVNYEKIDVEERKLLDGSICMYMPKDFQIMDEQLAEIKYPGEDKPQYIYTNEDTTVNFTFSIEEGEIADEEIEGVRDLIADQMKRLYPASKIEDKETITVNDKSVSCFSFDVPLIDGDVYNLMFFMALKKGLLMGTFNCSVFDKKQWRTVVKQILATIRETELEEQKEVK